MRRSTAFALTFAVVIGALFAYGCINLSTQPTAVAFEAFVELKNYDPECDADPDCWLPTLPVPKLVGDVSLSREQTKTEHGWPEKGDIIGVVCETTGGDYNNAEGIPVNKWFGILVPDKMVTFEGASRKDYIARRIDGGYLGYVGAAWIGGVTQVAPPCDG